MTNTHEQKPCTTSENNGSKATVWTTTQSNLMEEYGSPSPTSERREEETDGLNVIMLIVSDGYDETLNINSADL